jgi:hypothetical protein
MRYAKTILTLAFALSLAPPLFGADALFNCQSGIPFAYPGGGANIPFNPDQGALGPLNNAQAVAAVTAAFNRWAAISTTTVTFANNGPMPFDVTLANAGPILNPTTPDGLSPIVFDADGSIFTALFGPNSGILGFAGPDFGNTLTCALMEGSAFLNGPEFDDLIVAEDIMVHEFGHYINLGHVELNGQLIAFSEGGDHSGPSPDNTTFGTPVFVNTEVIETMYPFYFGAVAGTRTPHADDVASVSAIYPAASVATRGKISGRVLLANGTTRLSGVNVIARNLASPFIDAVSTFSGAFTDSTAQTDPNSGTFTIGNLTPGAQYALFIDTVTAQPGRFSNPIVTALPGPEEYWNSAESNANPPDNPGLFTPITAAANVTITADIIFNSPSPGDPLAVGDDNFVFLSLPFTYSICGQKFDAVFVNANGNLTFGAGNTDFSESAAEFLSGPPRIAALWDDLNAAAGGRVFFGQSGNSFTVTWENVPEFLATGSNTFSITLRRSSDHIDISYGGVTAVDGLAGVSCGSAITSRFETASDLSGFGNGRINLHNQPALFEVFTTANPEDLANTTVRFNGTTTYKDNWAGKNDSFAKARNIKLPFDSRDVKRYTEIEPAGADVDYYSFDAQAGSFLIAETLTGQIDSMIGLFDPAGNLIALDDDGGAGVLSRLVVPIPATGSYAIAVTTFPDVDFSGDGNTDPVFGQGRYVLEVKTSDTLPLPLGDDASVQLSLGFAFPFNGVSYTSVFVNSNGNLTFGVGNTSFSESATAFRSGPPRIAPLWDDLSPNNGGSVYARFGTGSVTVTYENVPEFVATGSNTFSVTLAQNGSVSIAYGAVSALDGLAGVTQGNGAPAVAETNLSAGGSFSAQGTTYEQFTGTADPFDLDNLLLLFNP